MRTLTAGATTWSAGPTYLYDILVESEDLNLRWSYSTTTAGGHTWSHRLHSIGEIETSIPPGGGIGAVSSLVIESVEDGTTGSLRDLWNTNQRLEGSDISLSILPAGEAYADKILRFTGKIDRVQWANGLGRITAVDTSLHADILLPTTLVTLERFPNAPEQSLNRPLPIFYGLGFEFNLRLAPLLLVDSSTLAVYRAAGHALRSLTTLNPYGAWPLGSRSLHLGDSVTSNILQAEITLDEPITAKLLRSVGSTPGLSISRETNVTSAANAIDGSTASLAVIGTGTLNANGDGAGELGIRCVFSGPEGSNVLQVTVQAHRRAVLSAPMVTGQFLLRLLNLSGTVIHENLFVSEAFRHASAARDSTFFIKPVDLDAMLTPELLVQVLHEGGVGTVDDTYEIGEISFVLGYQPESPMEQLYLDGISGVGAFEGRPDDAMGTITGTPDQRLDNPADIIRATMVFDVGAAVDSASFDAARTALDPQIFDGGIGAGWLHERLSARQVLEDMSRQAQSYLYPSGAGTFKLVHYDDGQASRFDFTQSHILRQSSTGGSLEIASTFEYSGGVEQIANTFRIRYAYHAALQQFLSIREATPSGCNHSDPIIAARLTEKCIDSVGRYGELPPLEIDAYWISHADAADPLLEHLVDYFWSQHIVVTFETTFVGVHLDVSDFITITHPELPDNATGDLFEITRIVERYPHGEAPTFRITAQRVAPQSVG